MYNPKPPETNQERFVQISDETDYRHATDPTAWYRYFTLGQYVVSGHTFDNIMNNIEIDPLRVHCMIWYQYMYLIDRKVDIPTKLDGWGSTKSQVYLAAHSPEVLLLNTLTTLWTSLSTQQSVNSD